MAGFGVGFAFQVHMSCGLGVVMDTRFVYVLHFCHTYFVCYNGRFHFCIRQTNWFYISMVGYLQEPGNNYSLTNFPPVSLKKVFYDSHIWEFTFCIHSECAVI